MAYPLVIFDFDGTLADSIDWFFANVNHAAARFRFKAVNRDEFERLRALPPADILRHLGVPRWKLPMIAADMRARQAADIDGIRLFDGVPDMLEALSSAGVAMAVVTSNAEANARRILGPEAARLVRHWHCGSGLFGKHIKMRAALRAAGVAPAQAIAIGDEIRDIEAARKAGIAAGAATWGYAPAEVLLRHLPDAVFDRPADIAARLCD